MRDPFGRCPRADDFARLTTREGRVEAVGRICDDLIGGRMPDRLLVAWFGSSVRAWLLSGRRGESIEHALDIVAPPRSRRTPQAIYRESLLRDCAQSAPDGDALDDARIETEDDDAGDEGS